MVQVLDCGKIEAALQAPQIPALSLWHRVLGHCHAGGVCVFDWPMLDSTFSKHHILAAIVEYKCHHSQHDHLEQAQKCNAP